LTRIFSGVGVLHRNQQIGGVIYIPRHLWAKIKANIFFKGMYEYLENGGYTLMKNIKQDDGA
jgi:hypothetical protein